MSDQDLGLDKLGFLKSERVFTSDDCDEINPFTHPEIPGAYFSSKPFMDQVKLYDEGFVYVYAEREVSAGRMCAHFVVSLELIKNSDIYIKIINDNLNNQFQKLLSGKVKK